MSEYKGRFGGKRHIKAWPTPYPVSTQQADEDGWRYPEGNLGSDKGVNWQSEGLVTIIEIRSDGKEKMVELTYEEAKTLKEDIEEFLKLRGIDG